jgi:hypothetical protein
MRISSFQNFHHVNSQHNKIKMVTVVPRTRKTVNLTGLDYPSAGLLPASWLDA